MASLLLSEFFPPPESADASGLVCVGGCLEPRWLLDAYRHGIFPWPVLEDGLPMAWWSLDPRAVIQFDRFHVSRRLARTIQSQSFDLSCNRDFRGVITGCARASGRLAETWLTGEMISAYVRMHELGHAHSVEAWDAEGLAGGAYGVAIGGLFAAESMFYRARDASKVALAHLVGHLRSRGYAMLDVQQLTPHTERMGASEIPRPEYLSRLARAVAMQVSFGDRLEGQPVPPRLTTGAASR